MVIVIGGILVTLTGLLVNNLLVISRQSKDLTIANAYAENKIESLRSAGYLGVEEGTYDFTTELPDNLRQPRSATYTVTSPSPDLKQIDVILSYYSGQGAENLTYRSYLGELGVGQY